MYQTVWINVRDIDGHIFGKNTMAMIAFTSKFLRSGFTNTTSLGLSSAGGRCCGRSRGFPCLLSALHPCPWDRTAGVTEARNKKGGIFGIVKDVFESLNITYL